MINPFKTQPVQILDKKAVAPAEIWLKLGHKLDFVPGQFIEISLPGFGESPVAPCSDPDEKNSFEIIVRAVGSLTDAVDRLEVGDHLFIRGPFGNGWPIKKLYHQDLVFLAGGMGLIPIRPLIHYINNHPKLFGQISLLIGSRNPESFLFKSDYAGWQKKFHYFKTIVDQGSADYKGRVGLITDLLKPLKLNPKKTKAIMCGPEVMCPSCVETLVTKGISADDIFVSMERRMKCGIGLCQHCNCGKFLVCEDGPVFSWADIKDEIGK